jgi:hypothetical protein
MELQSMAITVEMTQEAGGDWVGWVASPVPASKVVNVVILRENPNANGKYDYVPQFTGIATQKGPQSPNGVLIFHAAGGLSSGFRYGATLWHYQ